MAIKTQLRLNQLTGSVIDLKPASLAQGAAAASADHADLSDTLSYFAQAIANIHGNTDFGNQSPGIFTQDISLTGTTPLLTIGDGNEEDATILFNANAQDYYIASDDSADSLVIGLGSTVGSGVAITVDSSADVTFAGNISADQISATGLTGSLRDTNFSQNQIPYANAQNTLVGNANFTWDGTVLTLGGQSQGTTQLSVSGDAVITGDLTINGTTTTVNTTNLEVTDAVILLASGAAGGSPTKDMGIIMERQGGNIGFYWEETGDVMKLGFTGDYADDNALAAADGKLAFQVDKLYITGSSHYISYEDLGGGDYFNIATTGNMSISVDGGSIIFTDPSAQTSNGASFVIDMTTDREASFKSDDEQNVFFKLDSANTRIDISSGLHIRNGGSSTGGVITFLEDSDNGSNISVLRGPSSLADNNTVFELPSDNGTNGYVLQTNGSGVTSWAAQGGAGNSVKTFATVAATISSNSNLSSDSGYSTTDYSAISTANASKAIDVYVNGQLLQSGSGPYSTDVSDVGFTSGDYLADTNNMNALDVKFAFALEADDVVCIIGRA